MRCSSEMMWGEIAQTFGQSWVRGTICGTEDRCMWSHALGWKNVGTAAVGVGEKALSCTCSPGAETQKIFSLRLEDMGQNSFPRQALRAEPLARSRANQTCGQDRYGGSPENRVRFVVEVAVITTTTAHLSYRRDWP